MAMSPSGGGGEEARRPEPRGQTFRDRGWTRRLGYRILPGDAYSYILHLRPREWPIVAAHAVFGFLLAIPEGADLAERAPMLALGIALFVICLNGGTLAINSAFDRDEGDVGYLDAPPPPPPHLFAFGMALMIGGLVPALWLPRGFLLVYAACLLMSILYSVPPFRWKAVAGLDLIINALGFGVFTALAGWTLSGVAVSTWSLLTLAAFGPLFAALYPLTQLYQFEEDRRRGDRTLALVLGMERSLRFAAAMVVLAFVILTLGLVLGPGADLWFLLLLPLAAWLGLLLRWMARHRTMTDAEHKRGMYNALQAWALTNVAVVAAVLLPLIL